MKLLFVNSSFLKGEKYDAMVRFFRTAAEENGVELVCMGNGDIPLMLDENGVHVDTQADGAIFYDKDLRLAQALAEKMPVFNSPTALENADDKVLTAFLLARAGIPTIPTVPLPMTYTAIGYTEREPLRRAVERVGGYPLILKERRGSFGAQVWLVQTEEELMSRLDGTPALIQPYLATHQTGATDIRLNVVGGRVVCAIRRTNPTDFRSNIAQNGSAAAYTPSPEEEALAVAAVKALELDWAGVDLLRDKTGKLYVCEVNSNAHTHGTYEATGINVADDIIRYVMQRSK